MHIFEYKGTHYLSLKEHNFQILNAFKMGYDNDGCIYIQCTTNTSSGIVAEYLPKGWELSKKKYNGQMIFTLYKKVYFAYKSKSKSLGTICFIAFSTEGSKYLLYRWILNEQLGLDDNDINVALVEAFMNRNMNTLRQIDTNQKMFGTRVNMNDWRMKGILRDIEAEINKIA